MAVRQSSLGINQTAPLGM